MKGGMTVKTLMRGIKNSLGRYFAIFAITALGVGFFSGLKAARPAMRKTADDYFSDLKMYDFQLVSSIGFTDEDVEAFSCIEGINAVEGGYQADTLICSEDDDGKSEMLVYRIFSLPEKVSVPLLVAGEMPRSGNECAADSSLFGENDIGKILKVSVQDPDESDILQSREYVISGIVQSPRFIGTERGSSHLGSGEIAGFLYISENGFNSSVYTELLIDGDISDPFFTEAYDEAALKLSYEINSLLEERFYLRYNMIPQNTAGTAFYRVLDLQSNSGYASFENDIEIVNGIADVFPVFFVLISALVCITTMTRMVNEERIQIGTLKALGCTDYAIACKYILYAVSASLLGCITGFFLGISVIPYIIWAVYGMSYGFAELEFYFSPVMCICCIAVTAACSVGATLFACRKELRGKPAELVRPKAPVKGKRIFLERIGPLWKRLPFIDNVTVRNTLRYKKRMLLMLLGVGRMYVAYRTGLGLRDSVSNILNYQYDEILLYDAAVSFEPSSGAYKEIEAILHEKGADFIFADCREMTVYSGHTEKQADVIAASSEQAHKCFDLHNGKSCIEYPKRVKRYSARSSRNSLEYPSAIL